MDESASLQRFLAAQAAVYPAALAELKAGQKRSHWMWFVFPQLRGLGQSETAVYYGLASRAEAAAYLEHSVLGARLRECTEALLEINDKTANQIFGYPDDLKLRSSLTLFGEVAAPGSVFHQALDRLFAGARDARTLSLLLT